MGLAEQLDSRRRAMLAEMGVRVWLPQPLTPVPEPVALAAAPAVDAPVLGRTPAPAPAPALAPALAPSAQRVAMSSDAVASLGWHDMRAQVSSCQACGLCQQRQQAVFGAGSQRAHWLVVGEAPGEHEDRLGEPFVGPAGQLLDRMLLAMGVSRQTPDSDAPTQAPAEESPAQQAYITNVIKCRPPGNRNPAPEEVAKCLPYLQLQIALLQPRVILAMGRFAAQALLAESLPDVAAQPLGKLRGQVWRYQGLPVVVTYHPAYLLRNLPDKAKAWADLCLAMDVMEGLQGHAPAPGPGAGA